MPDNNDVTIRPYRPGDEHGIISLLEKVFHYRMPLEKWRFLFRKCPYGSDIILAVDGERIVGHQGRIGLQGTYFGSEKRIEHPVESCLLPGYRGYGFMAQCLKRYADNPEIMPWSFNSYAMTRAYGKIASQVSSPPFSYLTIAVPRFEKNIPFKVRKQRTGYHLIAAKRLPARQEIDRLWQLKNPEIKVGIKRDWKYLSWKMDLTETGNNPGLFFIISGAMPVGYVFLGPVTQGSVMATDIMILNDHVTPEAFVALESLCLQRGARKIQIVATDQKLAGAMKRRGYRRRRHRYFNCYDKYCKITPESFYLTFSDYWV